MNLYTFKSKLFKSSIFHSLFITFSLLGSYQILVSTELVKSSDGINQNQKNFILLQRYSYQTSPNHKVVLVGSSITATLPVYSDNFHVTNLGISGGCAQTGTEVVRKKNGKPAILLVEVNETIKRKIDAEMIDTLYNPLVYYVRPYLPMLKQEYQPFNTFFTSLISLKHKFMKKNSITEKQRISKQESYINLKFVNMIKNQVIEESKNPLSKKEENLLKQEAEYLKLQISELRQDGVRVILFNVPGEQQVQSTVRGQQIQALMRDVFPSDQFEWLPEPPHRHWTTLDGIHLIDSDAKDYAVFLRNQLLHN